MPMKISQIREYIPYQGQRSPFQPRNISNKTVPYSPTVPIQEIRAVGFENLQIHAYAYGNSAKLKIRSTTALNVSGVNMSYIVDWLYDNNKMPIDIIVNSYDLNQSTPATNFVNKIASLNGTGRYFAVLITGTQNISSTIKNALSAKDDCFVRILNGAVTHVAVGYSGYVIDSMFNGMDSGGASQIYVNGKNVSKGHVTIKTAENQPISFPYAGGSSSYTLIFDAAVDVDYILILHNTGADDPYIIVNHSISVIDASTNPVTERYVRQPTSAYLQTQYGQRLYLLGQIQSDTVVTGGIESSVSMAGMNAAILRLKQQSQGAVTKFFDEAYLSGNMSEMISQIQKLGIYYGAPNTSDNRGIIERQDLETVIRDMEHIRFNADCTNGTCSYVCFTDCSVVCVNSCGLICGADTCSATCGTHCGYSSCYHSCGSTCADGCSVACSSSGCSTVCRGGNCGTSCINYCQSTCDGTCAVDCAVACGGNCSATCVGGWAYDCPCTAGCTGTCRHQCGGTCANSCSGKTCGNDCGSSCGSACSIYCGQACTVACGGACDGHACAGICNETCTTVCSVICGSVCGNNCTSSCTGTCIAFASTVYF